MKEREPRQHHWEYSHLIVDAGVMFEDMLAAIYKARGTVDMEYYIFQLDELGERFIDALAAAASRGVRVRVLIDGVGSSASGAALAQRLFEVGVPVQIHNPLPWLTGAFRWSRGRGGWVYKALLFLLNINRRNHRKLCTIDGTKAWVGSFNISADHLAIADGGGGWRDYAMELRGPEVESLVRGFDRLWTARGPRFHRGFIARYLSNRSLQARRLKNRFVARSVARSSRRVWLVSAYFAPTARLRRALLRACRAGRDVRLLLPGESDVAMFPGLSSHYYRELLRAGARIFLYQAGVLHAKALLIDDFSIVGSSNWNYRSTLHDLELDVVIRSRDTVAALEQVVEEDCSNSRELRLEHTPSPSLGSWFWYMLRYWM
jgi:cardiolipin synthase